MKIVIKRRVYKNEYYIRKYIKFITSRKTTYEKFKTVNHHILPKSKQFFPQFKNLNEHCWNLSILTNREHFIAHKMLHLAFPGSSMSIAFFNMSNIQGNTNSKIYEKSKYFQSLNNKIITQCPIRNAKISKALTGKPKSAEHIAKLKGHIVSDETKIKLRNANLGKKHTAISKSKMSESRKGRAGGNNMDKISLQKMAATKMQSIIKTPLGIFYTFQEVEIAFNAKYGNEFGAIRKLFRCLNNKPQIKTLKFLTEILKLEPIENGIIQDYGFDLIKK